MAEDYEDPLSASDDEQPDDGPSAEELAAAEVPDPVEEARAGKAAARVAPPPDAELEHQRGVNQNLNAALRAEREQKRAIKRQNAELAQRQQRSEQRLEMFLQRVSEATGADISDLVPTAARVPDEATDPLGHLKGSMEQLIAPLMQKIGTLEQQLTTRELHGQVAEVERYVGDDHDAFSAEHPDYAQAEDVVLHNLASNAWAQAKAQYPNADEDDLADFVAQGVGRSIGNLKIGAHRDRRSLAAAVYAVAQRLGWQPAGEEQQPAQRGRQRASGKAGELQRNLQRTGATVTGLERSPRRGPVTLAGLRDMDDDEFDELTSKPGNWKKLAESAAV